MNISANQTNAGVPRIVSNALAALNKLLSMSTKESKEITQTTLLENPSSQIGKTPATSNPLTRMIQMFQSGFATISGVNSSPIATLTKTGLAVMATKPKNTASTVTNRNVPSMSKAWGRVMDSTLP